tara:strand:- start:4985 stop:5812 length:828 start_codon:yes stop_codon:yes gene_type:complete
MNNSIFKIMQCFSIKSAFLILLFFNVIYKAHSQKLVRSEVIVLSYNIHHANPPSQSEVINLDTIATIIKNSKADIVGLQEVDIYTERSGKKLHMAKVLAEKAGFEYWYFSKSINFQGGEYGTAILSKFPLSDTITTKLPNPKNAEPRTLSLANIHINPKLEIKIANTHLDYTDASNNLAQVSAIRKILSSEDKPVIITGDFNVVPESSSMNQLLEIFSSSCTDVCDFTSSAQQPESTIDYILYKSNTIDVLEHKVLKETFASDHFPVKARFLIYN